MFLRPFALAIFVLVGFCFSSIAWGELVAMAPDPKPNCSIINTSFGSICGGACPSPKQACTFIDWANGTNFSSGRCECVCANMSDQKEDCIKSGNIWDESNCACQCNQTLMKKCLEKGGIWDVLTCTCLQKPCSAVFSPNIPINMKINSSSPSGFVCTGYCENPKHMCQPTPSGKNSNLSFNLSLCSCACAQAIACEPPKIFDDVNCACACPGEESLLFIGDSIDAGNGLKIRLADIAPKDGKPAIIDIMDENGIVIAQIQVKEGETYTYTDPITNKSITIRVSKTAGGLVLSAKWAVIEKRPECPAGFIWDEAICNCTCNPGMNASCEAMGKKLNLTTCSCECPDQAAKSTCLTKGLEWNESNCTCQCNQTLMKQCLEKGGIWNSTTCSCVYKPLTCSSSPYPSCQVQDCPPADLNNGRGKAPQKCQPYNGKCQCVCELPNYVCVGESGNKTCCSADRKCCNGICCEPGLECVNGKCKNVTVPTTCASSYPACNVNDCKAGYECKLYDNQCICVKTASPCAWASSSSSPDGGDCVGSCSLGKICIKKAGWQNLSIDQRCECAAPPIPPASNNPNYGISAQREIGKPCKTLYNGLHLFGITLIPPIYLGCDNGYSCNFKSGLCVPSNMSDDVAKNTGALAYMAPS